MASRSKRRSIAVFHQPEAASRLRKIFKDLDCFAPVGRPVVRSCAETAGRIGRLASDYYRNSRIDVMNGAYGCPD